MADIATAVVSGIFAVAGSLGSVWLKDHLERRRHSVQSPADQPPPAPVSPPAHARKVVLRGRSVYLTVASFILGGVSAYVRPLFGGPSHPEAIATLLLLAATVIALLFYHAKPGASRGIAVFQLEVFALWAAFLSGWSVIHGSIWGDAVAGTGISWVVSAVAGLILIPLLRRYRA